MVRFTPLISERFIRSRRLSLDSAKTYEFSALRTCTEKRMSFPEPATAALNGRFSPLAENR
jgi:hypothetical protein